MSRGDNLKKYKTILFDIDDTLFDFDKDQKIAFKNAISIIGYNCTDKMYNGYNEINLKLWNLLNEGKIGLQELFIKRIVDFFNEYNIKQEPEKFNKIYTQEFQKTGTPIEGVKDVLEKLKGNYELVIATNGPKEHQYQRIENAGFSKYFSKIFTSEEVGFNKPDKKFFDKIFKDIENKDKTKILMVGDSLSSDIRGGTNSGIDTCWYNSKNIKNELNIKPTFEVNKLEEIFCYI